MKDSPVFDLIISTLRVSTPLIFAALGGMLSERSGVINIALEGLMLVGAFFGAVVALSAHSPWIGSLAALAAGGVLALFYGLLVIRLRANQIVAGTAINMLAMGLTPFLSKVFYGSTTAIPSLPIESRFHAAPILLAWVFVILAWYWIYHLPSGLWVRFAGEHPHALETVGVRVNRVRWVSVFASG
ncbi:MAG: ABC transporter permease, partial [Bdellovibrionota bacterium]